MNREMKIILGTLILLLQISGMAIASDIFKPSSWTEEKTYIDKASHKLGFGLLNVTAGWTELFYEPCRSENSFFAGLGKGLVYSFTDTAGGILHVATFLIPVDIPLPAGGISHEYKI